MPEPESSMDDRMIEANAANSRPARPGQVASLHLHPVEPGTPLREVEAIELVAGKGIVDDARYFGRLSRSRGEPSRRQVSLIEREQIADHAAALGVGSIGPGAVRSNIETQGIDLVALVGRRVQIGSAELLLYEPREPCAKMDAICLGLRKRMLNSRQGVLAEVVSSGSIRRGDAIRVVEQGQS
jgi:MOSC domain-containing protein YiiM